MNKVLETIFNENHKKFRYLKNLEIALRGGEYHFIEIKDNVIINSQTKSDYYLSIRGENRKNYFSFNSPFKDDLFNLIKLNQNIRNNNIIKYPFLKPKKYRNNNSLDISFEEYNNILLLELISKPVFKLLRQKFNINGFIYIKKDRISPFSNQYPIISIINNKGLFINHQQNKIVINFTINNNHNTISINKIFNKIEEIENYLNKEINNIEKKINLKKINNYIAKDDKIIFSSKAIAQILHKIKNNFSISDYYENKNNLFKNKLNQKIFSHKINIQSTPYHPLLLTAPFDETGEERIIVNLIKNGYLREFTVSYYESLKYKALLTGHSFLNSKYSTPQSLYLKGSTTELTDILNSENKIIFIDDLNISNQIIEINETIKITSLNSFIYKKGKIYKKIENLELNISISELFMKVVALTTENEEFGMITPEILVSL